MTANGFNFLRYRWDGSHPAPPSCYSAHGLPIPLQAGLRNESREALQRTFLVPVAGARFRQVPSVIDPPPSASNELLAVAAAASCWVAAYARANLERPLVHPGSAQHCSDLNTHTHVISTCMCLLTFMLLWPACDSEAHEVFCM